MTIPFFLRWLQEAPAQLDDVIARVEAERGRIRGDETLSERGRFEALTALRTSAEREVAAIAERASQAEESAAQHVAKALRPPTDTGERLLREQEDARAWERARRLLDAGADVTELVARAGQAGDLPTLRALRAEYPSWAETRAGDAVDDLSGSAARRAARDAATPILEDIDRAMAPHLPRQRRETLEIRFQVAALREVVRATRLLVDDILTGRETGGSWIRVGLATAEAERGLMGPPPAQADPRSASSSRCRPTENVLCPRIAMFPNVEPADVGIPTRAVDHVVAAVGKTVPCTTLPSAEYWPSACRGTRRSRSAVPTQ